MVSRFVASLVASAVLLGCGDAPYERPTKGPGLFVRAIPADGNAAPISVSGEVTAPSAWPPVPPHSDCTDGFDELREIEKSLNVESVGCPAQYRPVPAAGSGPVEEHKGFNVYCYPVAQTLLVVETTEVLGSCKHIVGVALFARQVP